MKRNVLIVLSIFLILSFTSCQNDSTPDAETTKATVASQETELTNPAVEYAEEIANTEDFKCVCQIDDGNSLVIEGDKAKEIYTYLKEQEKYIVDGGVNISESASINLVFQDGEPLVFQNQSTDTQDLPVLENPDSVINLDIHFYGYYTIYENDYVIISSSPVTSHIEISKLPDGTYSKILEMISE